MQARGSKQRKLVEQIPRELPWIESGLLLRDVWSAVEYGGISGFLGRLKARGHKLMGKWGQEILLKNKKISVHYHGCSGSGNGRWNCVKDGSRKRVQHEM